MSFTSLVNRKILALFRYINYIWKQRNNIARHFQFTRSTYLKFVFNILKKKKIIIAKHKRKKGVISLVTCLPKKKFFMEI